MYTLGRLGVNCMPWVDLGSTDWGSALWGQLYTLGRLGNNSIPWVDLESTVYLG